MARGLAARRSGVTAQTAAGSEPVSGIIRADGADLYYERRGRGPALLMISGGGGDAARYSGVADVLSISYTVLTYDRRGNANSRLSDGAGSPLSMAQQTADAAAVITGNGFSTASVFGNSGGAIIGLDLTCRRPELVDVFVGHEPPAVRTLPDAAKYTDAFDDIERTRRCDGWAQAAVQFMALNGGLASIPVLRAAMRRFLGGM